MSAKTDFLFYLKFCKKYTFCGGAKEVFLFYHEGLSGLEAVRQLDEKGVKKIKTRHPRIVSNVINCKKSINFQIKEYAKSCAMGTSSIIEILDEPMFKDALSPKWLEKSLRKQRWKIYFENEDFLKKEDSFRGKGLLNMLLLNNRI